MYLKRLIRRFIKVFSFSGVGYAAFASADMSWPWKILVSALLSAILAIIEKFLKMLREEELENKIFSK